MADFDQNKTTDNFDKEFSLNKKKKSAVRGKMPSWIMILAGAAVITGVVAARQPIIRPTETGTRSAVEMPVSTVVSAENAGLYVNDQQADPSELEALFGNHTAADGGAGMLPVVYASNDQAYNVDLQPLTTDEKGYIIPPEDTQKDAVIYWIDDKPYALNLVPAAPAAKDAASAESTSVYQIGGQEYHIGLDAVSESEMAALSQEELSGIIRIDGKAFRLKIEPAAAEVLDENAGAPDGNTTDTASAGESGSEQDPVEIETEEAPFAEETPSAAAPVTDVKEEAPVISWVNGKPYAVTVKPYSEETEIGTEVTEVPAADAAPTAEQAAVPQSTPTTAVSVSPTTAVIPVTILDDEGRPAAEEKPEQSVVFDVEGTQYEIRLKEMDASEVTDETTELPVVWIGTTPLQVELSAGEQTEPVPVEETGTEGTQPESQEPIRITLNPVPEEDLPELLSEHFGEEEAAVILAEAAAAAAPEVTEEPAATPEPTAVPADDGNWFVDMFHNIFGGSPTEIPTPQVTIVAMTPTAVPARPTQTPIVVVMKPTATVQGPVRLDDTENGAAGGADDSGSPSYLDDAPLWDDEDEVKSTPVQRADQKPDTADQTAVPEQNETAADRGTESAVQSEDNKPVQIVPTIISTPEELPHTGMAEGWNIPSMLALFAGLLLLIIGIRRLRSSRDQD